MLKQDENEAKYQKAVEAWRKEIGKWAIANFSKAENLRTNYRSYWNNTLNVDFDITKEWKTFLPSLKGLRGYPPPHLREMCGGNYNAITYSQNDR
jgi:hypothetical protein